MRFSRATILCCLLFIASSALLQCAVAEDMLKTNAVVVATVDGTPIYQREIDARPAEIEALAARREIDRLDARTRQIIEDQAIQDLGIRATKAEVRNEVDSKFEQAGIDETQAARIAEIL